MNFTTSSLDNVVFTNSLCCINDFISDFIIGFVIGFINIINIIDLIVYIIGFIIWFISDFINDFIIVFSNFNFVLTVSMIIFITLLMMMLTLNEKIYEIENNNKHMIYNKLIIDMEKNILYLLGKNETQITINQASFTEKHEYLYSLYKKQEELIQKMNKKISNMEREK